jgi:phytoene synthase
MREVMEEYSTTFFDCMKDFPTEKREDIYKLYAYLRVIDEMIEGEYNISDFPNWREVIEQFHQVSDKYQFKGEWLQDFHESMFTDLIQKEHTVNSMLEYCKGSAESVGMMMASIMGCPPEAEKYARGLGRAYQIINFIRDYEEDTKKGYHYISDNHELYIQMFREELHDAMQGLHFIPVEYRQPIIKASVMYERVANELS